MRENYLINEAVRKASSLSRYSIRMKKDTCLHDDVEYFMMHHQTSLTHLVDMLLNNNFVLARYTDPTYPL
jgi:hypothetical protein